MSAQRDSQSCSQTVGHAIANVVNTASEAFRTTANTVSNTTAAVSNAVGPTAHEWAERTTETIGQIVTPIAQNPLVRFATKAPGIKWLMAALGQVDEDEVQQRITTLQQTYPHESRGQLAQRIIADTATKAAGVGLVTNVVPPLALSLLAVDVAAVNALQAEMIYQIAALYGFSLEDSARRGEVLAIWGLSMGGSSVIKSGLSLVEMVPIVGPTVGVAGNAALIYTLGHLAQQFYANKLDSTPPPTAKV